MKTRIKTGKVSLVVFIALMAVCVAGVAIWCYAVGHPRRRGDLGGIQRQHLLSHGRSHR